MAAPAVLIAKAALLAAGDKRGRTVILSVIAAVLMPIFLVAVLILSLMSGTTSHNQSAVDLVFNGGYLSSGLPAEYRTYVKEMRKSFRQLETVVGDINAMAGGGTVDLYQVQSVFYSLFFGADQAGLGAEDYQEFSDCFVTYEERVDGEGNTYTVAVPIQDLETIYGNLESVVGRTVQTEDKNNVRRVYQLAVYGPVTEAGFGNGLPPGVEMGEGSFAALMAEATRYIGYPYVWGGSNPSTSFDCSGFICWVYTRSGVYNLPRTSAGEIYRQCSIVPKSEIQPGDLVFFTRTYNSPTPVSHVGIYVGGGQMLHAGSPIGYASIHSSYWTEHFFAVGRLPQSSGDDL